VNVLTFCISPYFCSPTFSSLPVRLLNISVENRPESVTSPHVDNSTPERKSVRKALSSSFRKFTDVTSLPLWRNPESALTIAVLPVLPLPRRYMAWRPQSSGVNSFAIQETNDTGQEHRESTPFQRGVSSEVIGGIRKRETSFGLSTSTGMYAGSTLSFATFFNSCSRANSSKT